MALRRNDRIQISSETLQQAEDEVTRARSRLLPQIDLTAEKTRQKELAQTSGSGPAATRQVFQHEKNHRYQFRLTQNLYHAGKTRYGYYQRKRESDASEDRHYRRIQESLFEVTRNYFQVLLANRNLEIARNSLQRAKKQLERARGRLEVGEINKTAVLRSEVTEAEARENVQRSRNELKVAYQRLGLSMGLNSRPNDISPIEFKTMPDSSIEELYEVAVQNRRDLERRKSIRTAAQKRLKWEQADFYPKIDLVSEFSDQDEPSFSNETEDWRISLTGSYPIFSGWLETAEISQAKSQLESAEAQIDRLRKEIKVELRNVYLDLKTQNDVISTVKDQVESAQENYDQVVAEFEQGISSAVDVNDAHTALREAKNRLARARYSYQLDLIRLRVVMGVFQKERIRSWLS